MNLLKLPQMRKLKNKITSSEQVPNTWCKLVNSQITLCPKCNKPGMICTSWHMKNIHSLEINDIQDIWRDICKITKIDQKRITRNKFILVKEKIFYSV